MIDANAPAAGGGCAADLGRCVGSVGNICLHLAELFGFHAAGVRDESSGRNRFLFMKSDVGDLVDRMTKVVIPRGRGKGGLEVERLGVVITKGSEIRGGARGHFPYVRGATVW